MRAHLGEGHLENKERRNIPGGRDTFPYSSGEQFWSTEVRANTGLCRTDPRQHGNTAPAHPSLQDRDLGLHARCMCPQRSRTSHTAAPTLFFFAKEELLANGNPKLTRHYTGSFLGHNQGVTRRFPKLTGARKCISGDTP